MGMPLQLLLLVAAAAIQEPDDHGLGNRLLAKGDRRGAAAAYERDLLRHADCYEARINVAAIYLKIEDPARAARQYRASLRFHVEDARAYRGLGEALLATGDLEAATGALREALRLEPGDRHATRLLRRARWRLRLRWAIPAFLFGVALAAPWILRRRMAMPTRQA